MQHTTIHQRASDKMDFIFFVKFMTEKAFFTNVSPAKCCWHFLHSSSDGA